MPSAEKPAPQAVDFSLRNPLMRSALQITLASALADDARAACCRANAGSGRCLPSFLVFTNTNSRGDTAMKALQRSIGTLFGIAIGLGACDAAFRSCWRSPSRLSVVCIFLAFYFLQISYATMTFFISIVLCLVYGMTGVLTLDLLQLRIEETVDRGGGRDRRRIPGVSGANARSARCGAGPMVFSARCAARSGARGQELVLS